MRLAGGAARIPGRVNLLLQDRFRQSFSGQDRFQFHRTVHDPTMVGSSTCECFGSARTAWIVLTSAQSRRRVPRAWAARSSEPTQRAAAPIPVHWRTMS